MTTSLRRGLEHIRTRSGEPRDDRNPQRKFLRVANLELRKTLCNKVREAAQLRVDEMDRQLAEIEREQAELLAVARELHGLAHSAATRGDAPSGPGSTTLKLKY